MEKLGIEETKELLKFAINMSFAGVFAYEDGKFEWSDIRYFLKLWEEVIPAFQDMQGIPAEIADLSVTEMDEICAFVAAELDENMKKEEALYIAKKLLSAIKAVYEAYLAVKGLHADA